MSELIRILVVDDHPIVRDGLVAILSTQTDFDVVAEAANGAEAIVRAKQTRPDIILTDIEMPELTGIDIIRQIRDFAPDTNFIVFTAFDTDERILSAAQAGAKGYLLKGAPREEVFRAIRVVSRGGSLFEPVVASRLIEYLSRPTDQPDQTLVEPLTDREMEVLKKLARGRKNREIADELFISERTVKFYVSAILGKLNASNRTEAVTIAVQRGLIEL